MAAAAENQARDMPLIETGDCPLHPRDQTRCSISFRLTTHGPPMTLLRKLSAALSTRVGPSGSNGATSKRCSGPPRRRCTAPGPGPWTPNTSSTRRRTFFYDSRRRYDARRRSFFAPSSPSSLSLLSGPASKDGNSVTGTTVLGRTGLASAMHSSAPCPAEDRSMGKTHVALRARVQKTLRSAATARWRCGRRYYEEAVPTTRHASRVTRASTKSPCGTNNNHTCI